MALCAPTPPVKAKALQKASYGCIFQQRMCRRRVQTSSKEKHCLLLLRAAHTGKREDSLQDLLGESSCETAHQDIFSLLHREIEIGIALAGSARQTKSMQTEARFDLKDVRAESLTFFYPFKATRLKKRD